MPKISVIFLGLKRTRLCKDIVGFWQAISHVTANTSIITIHTVCSSLFPCLLIIQLPFCLTPLHFWISTVPVLVPSTRTIAVGFMVECKEAHSSPICDNNALAVFH